MKLPATQDVITRSRGPPSLLAKPGQQFGVRWQIRQFQGRIHAFSLPLGGVGLEPDGAEVMSCGKADISIEGRRKLTEQGDAGLSAAFLDALDLVIGHACTDRKSTRLNSSH